MRATPGATPHLAPASTLLAALLVTACGGDQPPPPAEQTDTTGSADAAAAQDAFWASLESICGQAFAGRVTESEPPDAAFAEAVLVMHVRECGDEEIRVPFHVGEDRSRTWVFTRTAEGLRLKHDHRHEDGSEDEVTWYGGDTAEPGTAEEQAFVADGHTAQLLPESATNVWTVEIVPGGRFVYDLRRVGTERRFRAEFDLSTPVAEPPAPWGT
jgi:hypothetical protein